MIALNYSRDPSHRCIASLHEVHYHGHGRAAAPDEEQAHEGGGGDVRRGIVDGEHDKEMVEVILQRGASKVLQSWAPPLGEECSQAPCGHGAEKRGAIKVKSLRGLAPQEARDEEYDTDRHNPEGSHALQAQTAVGWSHERAQEEEGEEVYGAPDLTDFNALNVGQQNGRYANDRQPHERGTPAHQAQYQHIYKERVEEPIVRSCGNAGDNS